VSARILIVDDDTALLEALPDAIALRMNGIMIDTCETAPAALDKIRQTDYDVIVTDIKLPGMDGLELLDEIKLLRPGTPTVLITGHGERDLAVRALRGGAYDFVQKPLDRDYFVASLERAIHLRGLDRHVEHQRVELERHARVLQHVDRGVFLVDDEGVIRYWNPAAQSITGLETDQLVGRRADEALPGWDAIGPEVPVAHVPGPGSTEAKTLPLDIDGRELWVSISGVQFEDGIVYAFRNLTEERALDELKGEFVATVSHELRTPLAAIYGAAQTLRRADIQLADENRERLLEVIAAESDRLSRIAGEILLASNLDSGRFSVEREQLDVEVLVNEVVDAMRALVASRQDIVIDLVTNGGLAPVAGDADKLRQVLINLLDNAVKYSPDGGRIEVRVEPHDNCVRFAITDEGLGIPHGEQQRIFGKFYRLDPRLTRGVGGTGLGLYICRELVRRMDGRLSVTSSEGRGSSFVVDLPAAVLEPSRGKPVSQPAGQT
jgi:two-component system, OmpR family, phosphate regulon sensor histidine kinase PhoR